MRILFVIDGLPGGGAEKVVLTPLSIFCAVANGSHCFLCAMSAIMRCRKGWIIRL